LSRQRRDQHSAISTSEIKIAVIIDGQEADRAAQLTHQEFGLGKFIPPSAA